MTEQSILSDNVTILPENDSAIINISLRVRRKTSSQWLSYTSIIPMGEPCFAIDTGEVRIGDGIHMWSELLPSMGIHPDLYIRETIK